MGPTEAPLFKLLSARLGWLSQRQAVLAQNIANADTPDYQPKDLQPKDFLKLAKNSASNSTQMSVQKTDQDHLDGKASTKLSFAGRHQQQTYEVSPDGNAVILEEQTAKASQTALDHQLASNVYKKYVGMFKIALGSGGG